MWGRAIYNYQKMFVFDSFNFLDFILALAVAVAIAVAVAVA